MCTPLPPGVLELREELDVLDRENVLSPLRVGLGGTRVRECMVFLPAGGNDELMEERGAAAVDDLRMPVPR